MARTTKFTLWIACLAAVITGLFVSGLAAFPITRTIAETGDAPAYPVRFEMPSPTKALWAPSIDVPQVTDVPLPETRASIDTSPGSQRTMVEAKPDILPGLIPVNFRLGGSTTKSSAGSDQLIQATMPVVYNNGSIGSVPIWIDPNGAITMDSGKLSRALASANGPLSEAIAGSGQERVSFSSLRSRGMTINYDPIGDRIVMSYRS